MWCGLIVAVNSRRVGRGRGNNIYKTKQILEYVFILSMMYVLDMFFVLYIDSARVILMNHFHRILSSVFFYFFLLISAYFFMNEFFFNFIQ